MRKNLILPKNGVVLNLKKGERLYFLAGPIRGGGDWQAKAIKLLTEKDPDCYIVCPCRYDSGHELFKFSLLPDTESSGGDGEVSNSIEFPNQTLWERYYLEQASYYGSIIFWLPCENKENPRKKGGGPYARDTYGEIGRWSLKSSKPYQFSLNNYSPRVNVVFGAEKDFPGLGVIKKNLEADYSGTPIAQSVVYSSIGETISEAIKLAKTFNPSWMNSND